MVQRQHPPLVRMLGGGGVCGQHHLQSLGGDASPQPMVQCQSLLLVRVLRCAGVRGQHRRDALDRHLLWPTDRPHPILLAICAATLDMVQRQLAIVVRMLGGFAMGGEYCHNAPGRRLVRHPMVQRQRPVLVRVLCGVGKGRHHRHDVLGRRLVRHPMVQRQHALLIRVRCGVGKGRHHRHDVLGRRLIRHSIVQRHGVNAAPKVETVPVRRVCGSGFGDGGVWRLGAWCGGFCSCDLGDVWRNGVPFGDAVLSVANFVFHHVVRRLQSLHSTNKLRYFQYAVRSTQPRRAAVDARHRGHDSSLFCDIMPVVLYDWGPPRGSIGESNL